MVVADVLENQRCCLDRLFFGIQREVPSRISNVYGPSKYLTAPIAAVGDSDGVNPRTRSPGEEKFSDLFRVERLSNCGHNVPQEKPLESQHRWPRSLLRRHVGKSCCAALRCTLARPSSLSARPGVTR